VLRPHRIARVLLSRFCLFFRASLLLTPAFVSRMFKRLGALEKSGGGSNVSFLNTHPASDERVKVTALGFLRFDPLSSPPLLPPLADL